MGEGLTLPPHRTLPRERWWVGVRRERGREGGREGGRDGGRAGEGKRKRREERGGKCGMIVYLGAGVGSGVCIQHRDTPLNLIALYTATRYIQH